MSARGDMQRWEVVPSPRADCLPLRCSSARTRRVTLGTLILGWVALMTVGGKVVVVVDRGQGYVFSGVGPLGWSRRFDWSEVSSVREEVSTGAKGGANYRIYLEGEHRVNISGMLHDDRRYFLLKVLRTELARNPARR